MALHSDKHLATLIEETASPGGTTIYGLHQLELGGVRGTLMNAVEAATTRSNELTCKCLLQFLNLKCTDSVRC